MGNLAGFRKGEAYPSTGANAAGALANRNAAGVQTLDAPFTPNNSLIAALAFTPRSSGIVQVSGNLILTNGADADTYVGILGAQDYTSLVVAGGSVTDNGWVMGTTTPPTVGGTPGTSILTLESFSKLGSGESGSLTFFGISSSALTIGVPSLIALLLTQIGGGHALAGIGIANLSVLELP
jgi:hypothetical protein